MRISIFLYNITHDDDDDDDDDDDHDDVWERGITLPAPNGANGGLCSIIGATKSGVVVVTVDGHLLTETSVIGTIIDKLGVACCGRDAGAVVIDVDAAG